MKNDNDPRRSCSEKATTHTVLIADDDGVMRRMMTLGLTREGFMVIEAANGRDALQKIESFQPDVVITDVMMPEMDGLAVCEHVRGDARTKDLPIIIASAKASILDVQKGYQSGADVYLVKPIRIAELVETAHRLLAEKKRTPVPGD